MQTVKAENPPTSALALCGDERSPSHLSTLIKRVKEDEQQFGYARREHLINIAEYILSSHDYTPIEYQNAIAVLAHYHLAQLANIYPKYRKQSWKLIQIELEKKYKASCHRCGLPITNETSLRFGHGPVCRKKLGIKAGGE